MVVGLLSSVCYFNDAVIRQGSLISSLMPVAGYGALVLFLLCIQPLLRLLRGGAPLSGGEIAVVLGFFLMAAGIPGLGLVQYLPNAVMFPHHDVRVRPGWSAEGVVEIAPAQMLANVTDNEDRALDGYITGLGMGDRHVAPADVPWSAWTRTLAFWSPLLLSALLALLGLATVCHTQWAHHEQLPYPITTFTKALLPSSDGTRSSVFGTRLFWAGFLFVFALEMNNYLGRWLPDVLIPIKTVFDFSALSTLAPVLVRGVGAGLFQPRIWFAVVALAYFLPSDVSFSMTVCPFIYCFIFGTFAGYGVPFRCGRMLGLSVEQSIYAGGSCAIALMMLYTGRYYYWNVLRRGLFLSARDRVQPHAVWGMRAFLVCTALFIVQLVCVGLDWQLAIIYTAFAFMIHLVISRMIVETGGFIIGTYVYPGVMIWAFCGSAALGPRTMLIMFLVSTVLVSGPGWAPMPFFVQALNLADVSKVSVAKAAKWGVAAVVLALLIAIPCTIYWQYDRGAPTTGWTRATAWYSFENMVEIKQKLRGQGVLEQAETVRGWQRLSLLSPHWDQILAFGIALGVALAFGLGRLRFTWWPFHPMAFVFLGGWPGYYHWFSFLLGWLIKTAVTRYGGARMYQRLKPLMIGLIAGSMLAKFVPMVVGPITYFFSRQAP